MAELKPSGGRRRPGPVPKGTRKAHTTRFPVDHLEVYKREADSLAMPLGDYLAMVLARAHGLPRPDYLDRNRDQPPLLLTGS